MLAGRVRAVKRFIEGKIQKMLAVVLMTQMSRGKEKSVATGGGAASSSSSGNKRTPTSPPQPEPPAKRKHLFTYENAERDLEQSSHLLGGFGSGVSSSEEDEEDAGEAVLYQRALERAGEIMDGYKVAAKAMVKTKEKRAGLYASYPRSKTHKWWGNHSSVTYKDPNTGIKATLDLSTLRVVVQAVLALTGGSGILERDFCDIPRLVTMPRGGMSPITAEMNLVAHALQKVRKITPDDVLVLSKERAEEVKPPRLKDRRHIESLSKLDFEDGIMDDIDSAVDMLSSISTIAEIAKEWTDFGDYYF